MDLGLAGRVVVVAGEDPAVGAACARLLADEGAVIAGSDDLASAEDAVSTALAEHGRVDGVVACHALHPPRRILDLASPDELHGSWEALVHTVAAYRAALPSMTEHGWGRLVTVTTSTAKWLQDDADEVDGLVGLGLLGMSKAAVADVASHGIAVNSVLRGPGDDPDDVAALVAFLASDRAGYLHGVAIALDGAASPAVF